MSVYERLTDRSRKVMQMASQEAQRLGHEYVGTEHVLIALAKEGSGVAANAIRLHIDLGMLRVEVERRCSQGPAIITLGKLPLTPAVKRAFAYAEEEMGSLGHNWCGTEHILLGLLRLENGTVKDVFDGLGVSPAAVRESVVGLLPPAVLRAPLEFSKEEAVHILKAMQLYVTAAAVMHVGNREIDSAYEKLKNLTGG